MIIMFQFLLWFAYCLVMLHNSVSLNLLVIVFLCIGYNHIQTGCNWLPSSSCSRKVVISSSVGTELIPVSPSIRRNESYFWCHFEIWTLGPVAVNRYLLYVGEESGKRDGFTVSPRRNRACSCLGKGILMKLLSVFKS